MDTDLPDPRYSNPSVDVANSIALPIFAVIASLAIILPFRAFYILRNFSASSMVVTLWIINFSTFINAIIWHTDDWTTWWEGPVLCDIESILRWPVTLSATTSVLCFIRGLANALDTKSIIMNPTKYQRRRKLMVEILIVWGMPVVIIGLHYIIQAGRYAIIPVFGCTDEIALSWPYIVIIVIWAPLFTIIACYYSAVLLHRLKRHRRTVSIALSSTGSGMNSRKFIKLALIGLCILLIYLPTQIIFLIRAIPSYMIPYDWSAIHDPATWSEPSYYHTQDSPLLQYNGWAAIAYSLLLAPFYGLNDDAICTYRRWLVMLSLGKIWPSLKEPYRPRRTGGSSDGSFTQSESRFSSRFDLVSKVMHFLENESDPNRGTGNISVGSTTLVDSPTIGGRNNFVSTSPTSQKGLLTSHATHIPPTKHNNFATIRNFNPFIYFSHTSFKFSSSDDATADGDEKSFTAAQDSSRDLEANNISTIIWSPIHTDADTVETQSSVDPLSPPLGSRAYRERERREMERDKAEKKAMRALAKTTTESDSASVVDVSTQLERKEEGRDDVRL